MKGFILIKCAAILVLFLILYALIKKPDERIYKINVIEQTNYYNLVEDFNDELKKDYWNMIDQGNNYNNALQYYTPNNLIVKDGFLEIQAKKEFFKDHQYTSGSITTKGKFEFLYGKIFIKAKPASGTGLLSAIWLLPADNTRFPEVDLIEVLGSEDRQIWTGVHYLGANSALEKNFNNYLSNNDLSLYEFEWNENEIKCYVDNMLVYTTNVGVPNKKMYLIIDLAVGGNWPKDPDDKILPAKFLIDYVIIIPKGDNIP